ncbi:pseudaminic acid cytidylyltransferase [Roseospira marina]|uniref:Pseudaminic acid cytidylyltransferase n=1 Tax=Roseospira marina TaxID=140057 RepID=A0A5M6I6T2_9PROT|nr:pseudaminic acid cytidylyltransferase [Roseospira marina]KAA5603833.1 pseudaminic acid cytidylyltransferase [Roseospira marina]MBB4313780.1 N-acylneuraminate cytidylyltransferase [Roseospira marina]MBB5086942.1 N-acylneuraminate cytidylyltransferase [Roseospira marina]
MTAIAVIPARGGSTRIPRKNVRSFHGKPIMVWAIEAALVSGCFDAVVVSTEDDEIAAVAETHGAVVPFRRSRDLADDHTGMPPIIADAAQRWAADHGPPDLVCCIFATAPFVTPDDLRRGRAAIEAEGASYAFGVTDFAYPIQRALRLPATGGVALFYPEFRTARSQDLEPAYHDAGQFCWGTYEAWVELRSGFAPDSVPVRLPRRRVQDIDTEEDWIIAERLFALDREGAAP